MYFDAITSLLRAFLGIFDELSETIRERGPVYHRGAFYADTAKVIRLLLEMRVSPFIESEYNWAWWADECEKRAEELGNDAQYAVALGDPMLPNVPTLYSSVTLLLDSYTSFLLGGRDTPGIYGQEAQDSDFTDLGQITPAECVKITHRLVHYKLGAHTGTYTGRLVAPWITAVATELRDIYLAMGEPNKAGSAWNVKPGQPIPPISWPG
jgi:hypothetical protein